MTAKQVLQNYITVDIDTISTKCETIYISSAIRAMEEYANIKLSELIRLLSLCSDSLDADKIKELATKVKNDQY